MTKNKSFRAVERGGRRRRGARAWMWSALAGAGLAAIGLTMRSGEAAEKLPSAAIAMAAPASPAVKKKQPRLDWSQVAREETGFAQRTDEGARLELTLDPEVSDAVDRALDATPAPYASAVVVSVEDGRVLALAGRSKAEPETSPWDLATRAWAPAASIFKLVTAAALVERGVGPDSKVCYHGGVHSVEESNLTPHARWDDACATLSYGVAKSQNAILARLAHEHLDATTLERTARALGFGAPLGPAALLGLSQPLAASQVSIPKGDALSFARTAAGFWNTTLSPLHGAVLAATLARGGVTPPLHLVARTVDADGHEQAATALPARRVLPEEVAHAVGKMMVGTTDYGTARLGFHDKKSGKPVLGNIAVAGKTGSLFRRGACTSDEVGCQGDFLAYSWFVGYAPADHPKVAIAVLLGNGPDWHKKAHNVAAEILTDYFHAPAPAAAPAIAKARPTAPAKKVAVAARAGKRHAAAHGRPLVARR